MNVKSNNHISRDILEYLERHYPKADKFVDMVKALGTDEKALFKNLFFLEETSLVQLMSSYPAGATYPTIHMVKIRDEGRALLADPEKLDTIFPLKGFSSRLDFKKLNTLKLSQVLDVVSSMIEEGQIHPDGSKDNLLSQIKEASKNPALSELTLGKIFENLQ